MRRATGRLLGLHRGVYAVGHRRLDWHGRCLAAVLACAPAFASHLGGLVVGSLRHEPGTIELTAPTRRHSKIWCGSTMRA